MCLFRSRRRCTLAESALLGDCQAVQVCTVGLTLLLSNCCHAELFEATGSASNAALLNTVIIGAVNVASTVVAILVVDR